MLVSGWNTHFCQTLTSVQSTLHSSQKSFLCCWFFHLIPFFTTSLIAFNHFFVKTYEPISCKNEITSLVQYNVQRTETLSGGTSTHCTLCSGFSSWALLLFFPVSDDAVLHCFIQAVLSYLRDGIWHALSSLCKDGKNLQSFALYEFLSQTLLCLDHVLNYDHSTMT